MVSGQYARMTQERMALSTRERDRLKVLDAVIRERIRQAEAAAQMGVSERWVRELVARFRRRGDQAVVHGLRGRPSNRKIAAAMERKAVRLVRTRYSDFGPTLASEYLAEKHGLSVSRETVRKWMMGAGLWQRRGQQVERVHLWRPRRSCFGELVQWDTSDHDWLEGRGEKLYLVGMIDDASSRAWGRFVRHDSTPENMQVLWGYLDRYGRPLAFYTDKASLFQTTRQPQLDEELRDEQPRTQIGRALEELRIEWIPAHSPQAKGRIERCFGTLQDRLVKALRVAGVTTMKGANEYLEQEFWPMWERRFAVLPAKTTDAHRPLEREHDLAAILSHVESRVVMNDYTIRVAGASYRVVRRAIRPGLRGARVRVEQRLDGTVAVRFRDQYLTVERCAGPQKPVSPAPPLRKVAAPVRKHKASSWMRNFNLHDSPPLWKIVQQEQGLGR